MCRAAQSKVIQNTFVAKEGKDRKKARLSWYHPDDTVSCCASHFPLPAQCNCTEQLLCTSTTITSLSSITLYSVAALKDPTRHVVQQSQELEYQHIPLEIVFTLCRWCRETGSGMVC